MRIFALLKKLAESKKTMPISCILCGVMGAIPYYCEELFVFTFISLFLQFYIAITQRRAYKRVFLPFFMYFLGFFTPLYLFLAELYPYERFGFTENQAVFIVICSCILIPLIHSAVVALIFLTAKLLPDSSLSTLGYAAIWVIGEWILTLGLLAFPWGNIAVSLTGFLPYLQTASLFGKSFISFITVFGCAALAYACFEKKRAFAFLGVGIIGLNTILGTVIYSIPFENNETVKVAAVQGNALADQKFDVAHRSEIIERTIALAEEAAQNGAKIIALPESAFPVSFTENGRIHQYLAEITTKYDVTIITGASYYENGDQYNSAIGIMPDGSLSNRYDKRHLVPFGEFIPFVDLIGTFVPFVAEFNAETGTFIEGTMPVVIATDYGCVTPLVCFDSIFPKFAAEGVENGADLIAVVTNDSWFNDSFGIYTHLRHSQLRAIENRRYIVRSANTGISAIIDEHGRIIHKTEPLTADIVYADVSRINNNTLYSYIGDCFLYISFITVAILIIYNLRRVKNGNNSAA